MIDPEYQVVNNPRQAAYMIYVLTKAGERIGNAENLLAIATEAGFLITPEYARKAVGWYEAYRVKGAKVYEA